VKLGIIGWRGMVGSVLLERMLLEQDFAGVEVSLFSTSQSGSDVPAELASAIAMQGSVGSVQLNAHDVSQLKDHDIIISCQGGDYTTAVHAPLRESGWSGYWIDAASTLRMAPNSIIVLDPLNGVLIDQGIKDGVKDFVGGNCTVSLMLMALAGLFREDLVEWITSMTYQAASGAGAEAMKELLELEKATSQFLLEGGAPCSQFGAPLATNLLPWIDKAVDDGQTREEWKGFVETNKILGRESNPIIVDGACVRVGALRCHSQALTIKLKEKTSLERVNQLIASGNEWVELVENNRESSITRLTPLAVSGTLKIAIGRVRPLRLGMDYYTAFTVGDQLLWGAAEPLRRVFRILKEC
jgi:aspartate-semialdehyde dehydrogenase